MAMLPTQSWLRALAGKLTWNTELPLPNGDRTTPRLILCKCATQVTGTWLVGMSYILVGRGTVNVILRRCAGYSTPPHSMRVAAASMP